MSGFDYPEDVVENIIGERESYMHGGNETPQYYCPVCNRAHTRNSRIGMLHLKYMRS